MADSTSDQGTEQIGSQDLPLYDKPTLPEKGQLVLLVEEPDYDCGGTMVAAYRLPLNRVVPVSAQRGLAYSLADADAGITVADQTIVPAYVESFGSFNIKKAIASSSTTKAKFIIVSNDPNVEDSYIIQGSGFFSFSTVHAYNPGQTYYLSDSVSGGVTTTPPPGIAQPLFYVVDQKTILISIGV